TRLFFLFSTPSSTKLYPLSLHDALPIYRLQSQSAVEQARAVDKGVAVETAEPRELGMLQPGDHAEDAALLAMPELRLEADHVVRSEEHTSELQSPYDLVCRLLLEKKRNI